MHENNLPALWALAGVLTLILAGIMVADAQRRRRPPARLHESIDVYRPEGSSLWAWRCSCGAGDRGFDARGNAVGQALGHLLHNGDDRG